MRLLKPVGNAVVSTALLFCSLLITGFAPVSADEASIAAGKDLAFNRKKGNCLACHAIAGGSLPGDIGPPLIVMKARFPDKAKLRAQIWDASASNPSTIMPPFGRHNIISEAEIDKITDFIHTL